MAKLENNVKLVKEIITERFIGIDTYNELKTKGYDMNEIIKPQLQEKLLTYMLKDYCDFDTLESKYIMEKDEASLSFKMKLVYQFYKKI